jgi:hypothetical protein
MTLKEISIVFCSYLFVPQLNAQEPTAFVQYSIIAEQASNDVLDENFEEALAGYKLAMKTAKPYVSHSFTGMQLSAYLRRKKDFFFFLKKSFELGLEKNDIYKDSLLSHFINDKNLTKRVENFYKRKNIKYLVNSKLKKALNKISALDNKWKVYYIDSLARIDTLNKINYEIKYDSINKRLVESQLIPLIKKYGFPGERLVGFNRLSSPDDAYNYTFQNNKALFILLHYYSRPKSCKLNPILLKEVLKGNMKPQHYASIIDFQYKYNKNKCDIIPYNQWWVSPNFNSKEINMLRLKIGLLSYENETRKVKRGIKICKDYRNGKYKHIKLFYWCG